MQVVDYILCTMHLEQWSGTTNWDIEQTLNCLYWLFKDSPARRDDYTKVTGSAVFPVRYCQHRWLENVTVLERVITIWPQIQTYVANVNTSKIPHPKNKSFEVVEKACTDPMFLVKANIFLSIAQECQPFLIKYQTDKPMLPFVADSLFTTLKHLLQRFVTDDTLKRVKTPVKLFSEDFNDCDNHKDASLINIGFVADKLLSELRVRKKVSERDVFMVRKETKEFLVKDVTKLLEKCPLRYTLVRNLAWLDPQKKHEKPDLCEKQLKLCLQIISSAGQIKESKCDTILNQFRDFAAICKMSEDASQWPTGAHSTPSGHLLPCTAGRGAFIERFVGNRPKDSPAVP